MAVRHEQVLALDDPARVASVRSAERAAAAGDARLLRTAQLATRLLGVDFAFVSLVGEQRELLTAVAGARAGQVPDELPVELSVCQHLVLGGVPLLVPDLQQHPALCDLVEARALGLHSYAGTPLLSAEGHVIGGFCVGHSTARTWTVADSALLADLASTVESELQLRVALEELRRLELLERRRAEQQSALHRVATLVARGEEPAVVRQAVADELTALLDGSAALVLRFLPDGRAELAASAGSPVPGREVLPACANALALVRGSGRSALAQNGDQPCAAVPVTVDGTVWGAVLALTTEATAASILQQLEALADFLGLVVVNAEAQQRLRDLARSDSLTGAANRRAFDERLQDELQRSRRHGHALTLLFLDVDHFKRTNDRAGHDVGDRVLQELTERVRLQLRDSDLLARLGGDEFAVLLPETDQSRGVAVAERVRRAVGDLPLAGRQVTVSIGAAVVPDGATSPQVLCRLADSALYESKAAGRDTVALRALG